LIQAAAKPLGVIAGEALAISQACATSHIVSAPAVARNASAYGGGHWDLRSAERSRVDARRLLFSIEAESTRAFLQLCSIGIARNSSETKDKWPLRLLARIVDRIEPQFPVDDLTVPAEAAGGACAAIDIAYRSGAQRFGGLGSAAEFARHVCVGDRARDSPAASVAA
jgi:hypothetical protein